MPERYPDDAMLLALAQDAATGVEYIPTGKSPYFLEARRLTQRSLLAGQRANDLRVYQDGDLAIGVRPGRCVIDNTVIDFVGSTGISVAANNTTHVWLDATGSVTLSTSAMPTDRATIVPLARVVTGGGSIVSVTDLRGEAFLHVPSLTALGVTVPATQINQAVNDGVGAQFVSFMHDGDLTSSLTDTLMGDVPIGGVVTAVTLSLGTNMVSSTGADGVSATVKVNGTAVTTVDPLITSAAGTGHRSTTQSDGTAAVIKTDGTQNVNAGDVLTVDLTRTAVGTVTTQPAHVVVTVRIDITP